MTSRITKTGLQSPAACNRLPAIVDHHRRETLPLKIRCNQRGGVAVVFDYQHRALVADGLGMFSPSQCDTCLALYRYSFLQRETGTPPAGHVAGEKRDVAVTEEAEQRLGPSWREGQARTTRPFRLACPAGSAASRSRIFQIGAWIAPGIWPARNSKPVRTSITAGACLAAILFASSCGLHVKLLWHEFSASFSPQPSLESLLISSTFAGILPSIPIPSFLKTKELPMNSLVARIR